MNITYSAIKF